MPAPRATAQFVVTASATAVTVLGRLDAAGIVGFHAVMEALAAAPRLVIDLTSADGVDGPGWAAIDVARQRCRARGTILDVRVPAVAAASSSAA